MTLAVDAADTGQGRSTSECGHSSCEQTAQEILPVEIIMQGEMFQQPGRILGEESQGSVESDRLSTLDPLIHNDMPASPPQNHQLYLREPDRGQVSFEEATRCVNESQPERLFFRFEREVDGYDEAYKEHRHQFIDAVNTCQSLKELTIYGSNEKLSIEEVQLLCQNLLPALNESWDNDGVQIVCEKMANNCVLKKLTTIGKDFMTGPCHAVQDLTDFIRYRPNCDRNLFFGDGFKGSLTFRPKYISRMLGTLQWEYFRYILIKLL